MRKRFQRLNNGLALRRLAVQLDASLQEAQNFSNLFAYKSLVSLYKSRPVLLKVLKFLWLIGLRSNRQMPKLSMWLAMAAHNSNCLDFDVEQITNALINTEAWSETHKELLYSRWNSSFRFSDSQRLMNFLLESHNQKIFLWHHYDPFGYLPKTWIAVLEELTKRDWLVVVSSSNLSKENKEALENISILVTRRLNIGLCIGAYRDFSLLLADRLDVLEKFKYLILANDSTIPILGSKKFCDVIDEFEFKLSSSDPMMVGMTDSIERNLYHLQSYLLGVNNVLMKSNCWRNFWHTLPLKGDKDNLIDQGEIGLTQAMISSGVSTWSKHGLMDLLVSQNGIHAELASYNIFDPREVNMTLFAWRTLLKDGFPLIKKQVLFGFPMSNSSLNDLDQLYQWIPDGTEDFKMDLRYLLRSRFSNKYGLQP